VVVQTQCDAERLSRKMSNTPASPAKPLRSFGERRTRRKCPVIRFDRRPNARCRVFVRVSATTEVQDIAPIFSRLSLLHHVHLQPVDEENNCRIGIVAYYAPTFATQATLIFDGIEVKGFEMQVWPLQRFIKCPPQHCLDSRESILVLNHFLGFDGWSSKIVEMSVTFSEKAQRGGLTCYEASARCRVEVIIRGSSPGRGHLSDCDPRRQCFEGFSIFGSATISPDQAYPTKAQAIQMAQKCAVTEARKQALQNELEITILRRVSMAWFSIVLLASPLLIFVAGCDM